jgi:hypothetical protein
LDGKKNMKKTLLTVMTLAGLVIMADRSEAQIGWTLDQCKAEYGEGTKTDEFHQPKDLPQEMTAVYLWAGDSGETYIFDVSGFKLVIGFPPGVDAAIAVGYVPEVPLYFQTSEGDFS